MSQIINIEIFFLEYPFPKHLNYKYSGGIVENMIVPLIRVIDSDGEYGMGEVTHGQFTHQPLIGLVKHFNDMLVGSETNNINQAWEKIISQYPYKEKINTMISTEENDIKLV